MTATTNIALLTGPLSPSMSDLNTLINSLNTAFSAQSLGTLAVSGAATLASTLAVTGAITATGGVASADNLTMTAAAKGLLLKQGANGKCGTFICNGATGVTVNNTSIATTDTIVISLNTVGGTVGAVPAVKTITASTGFTVAGTASDTSTYNYAIISNAA